MLKIYKWLSLALGIGMLTGASAVTQAAGIVNAQSVQLKLASVLLVICALIALHTAVREHVVNGAKSLNVAEDV